MAAAGLTVGIGLIVASEPDAHAWTWLPLFVVWTAAYAGSFAILPFAVAIVFSEAFRLRSVFFWLAVGGGTALAGYLLNDISSGTPWSGFNLSFHLAAGFVAGAVYWAVAGRSAGVTNPSATP